ncbi:MAG: RNA-binding protein [Methanothermobacter sp.]|nr:RNA-binding protein [Methanothermobacter sp.]
MKVKRRYHLKKREVKRIKEGLADYSGLIPEKAIIEFLEVEPYPLVLVDGEPLVMLVNKRPFPTLKGALKTSIKSNRVVVDMGAVKFLVKGADVMSPGIVDADPRIEEGDLVIVVDEKYKKPITIGISLIDGPSMVRNRKGKAIKNIHYIGDKIWNLEV